MNGEHQPDYGEISELLTGGGRGAGSHTVCTHEGALHTAAPVPRESWRTGTVGASPFGHPSLLRADSRRRHYKLKKNDELSLRPSNFSHVDHLTTRYATFNDPERGSSQTLSPDLSAGAFSLRVSARIRAGKEEPPTRGVRGFSGSD